MNDSMYAQQSIEIAQRCVDQGGYPVGALVVRDGMVIAEGWSDGKQQCDATMHAEIDAIRQTSQKLAMRNLTDVTLYTSMEPCVMCFSACYWAHIPRVVYVLSRAEAGDRHSMGEFDIHAMNEKLYRRKIELIHATGFTEQAKQVILDWEKKRSNIHKL